MYNTVGETAGVTQDVGSDPTVGHFTSPSDDEEEEVGDDSELFYCTYCGRNLELGEGYVKLRVGGEEEEGKRKRKRDVNVNVFDLSEMSRMEEEDEDMDGEPDNGFMDTDDEAGELSSEGGREGGEKLHDAHPERKTS